MGVPAGSEGCDMSIVAVVVKIPELPPEAALL
jgi:hypothetical protein